MKNFLIVIISIMSLSMNIKAQEKLIINTKSSTIKWNGYYTFYFGGHEGTINFTEGYFIKTNDKITGGSFIIDMNTLVSTDIEKGKAKTNLENHLKDPDFFDVQKHPKASLIITKVKYFKDGAVRIEANLTLKSITKPINFNATMDYENKRLTTKFKIDRRRWKVNYTSKVRDGAISDAIGFDVTLQL
ncbi:YceI family protein [Tenacibaculum halocynthiae]|uniref:YceI family protein n=1 Tax=Tenacibaculum halocynthiae TaxID=1254437 RepID=UPI00260AFAFD|nr:YceI family protein [uncultured Tenacibaculum sp.]